MTLTTAAKDQINRATRSAAIRDLNKIRTARQREVNKRRELTERTEAVVRSSHKAGMTPSEIAEHAGVSRQTVHTILRKER